MRQDNDYGFYPVNQRIKLLIEDMNLDESAFSIQTNVIKQTINNITHGKFRPKSETLIRIAESIPGLNIRWLLTGEGKMWERQKNIVSEPTAEYYSNKKIISALEETVLAQKKTIESLTNEIELLKQTCAQKKLA